MKQQIKLGQMVKDIVSGFSGVVIQSVHFLNDNVQYAIQPSMKEGDKEYPGAMFLDWHTLDVVNEDLVDRVTPAVEASVKLGNIVRDKASDFTGVATQKATYFNGCVSFLVMPKVRNADLLNQNPEGSWIDHGRLVFAGHGLDISDKPNPASGKVTPGGPATRVTNRY